jgi:hypothetical protein
MAAEPVYMAANGVNPTVASFVTVTTGTAIKTMLQVATPSTTAIRVVGWGISFEGSAAATPIKVELIQTDVAATVTSVTPTAWSDANGASSLCVGGSALTGHTATAEGTITVTRILVLQFIAPTAQYVYEFSLGREPHIPVSKFLRIRLIALNAVNCYCWIRWAE